MDILSAFSNYFLDYSSGINFDAFCFIFSLFRSENDERSDVKNFQIKARDTRKKQQVFVSLYNE